MGVGGHCIPINPHFFFVNNELPLLKQAASTTAQRPSKLATEYLQNTEADAKKFLVIGVAFKPGESETTYAPGLM